MSRTRSGTSSSSQRTRLRCSPGSTKRVDLRRAGGIDRRSSGRSSRSPSAVDLAPPVGEQVLVADERPRRWPRVARSVSSDTLSHAAARLAAGLPRPVGLARARQRLGGMAQHRDERGRHAELARARIHSGRNQTVRGSLTDDGAVLLELPAQPRASSPWTAASLGRRRRDLPGGRPRVVDRHAARLEQPGVEVDDPARLAEPARVGLVGVDLGLRDVEAELAEDARRAGSCRCGPRRPRARAGARRRRSSRDRRRSRGAAASRSRARRGGRRAPPRGRPRASRSARGTPPAPASAASSAAAPERKRVDHLVLGPRDDARAAPPGGRSRCRAARGRPPSRGRG